MTAHAMLSTCAENDVNGRDSNSEIQMQTQAADHSYKVLV